VSFRPRLGPPSGPAGVAVAAGLDGRGAATSLTVGAAGSVGGRRIFSREAL
jgi:hypothetical protein